MQGRREGGAGWRVVGGEGNVRGVGCVARTKIVFFDILADVGCGVVWCVWCEGGVEAAWLVYLVPHSPYRAAPFGPHRDTMVVWPSQRWSSSLMTPMTTAV
jgi:hypothetical protein